MPEKNPDERIPFQLAPKTTRLKIEKLREEYRVDFPRYCKERLQIIDRMSRGGSGLKSFELNHGQLAWVAFIERIERYNLRKYEMMGEVPSKYPIHTVDLKARRIGLSTVIQGRLFWRCDMEPALEALTMAHERPAAENLLGIQRRFHYTFKDGETYAYRNIPAAISHSAMKWAPDHGSTVTVKTAGSKRGSSRSFGYHFLHISEEAHFEESDEVASALAAKTPFSEIHEESTANGEGNIFHKNWEQAQWIEDMEERLERGEPDPEDWNGAFRFFWPWHQDPSNRLPLLPGEGEQILATLDDRERELIDKYAVGPEQLKWRRRTISNECTKQNKLAPEDYFDQEYPGCPEDAFIAAGKTVFDQRRLGELDQQARDLRPGMFRIARTSETEFELKPTKHEKNANCFIWAEPQHQHAYIGGSDSAEGLEHGDDSVIVIYDREDGMNMTEVCRVIGKIPAEELGEVAVWLGKKYNDCFFVNERNAPGNAACAKFVKLEYPHQYHTFNPEKVGELAATDGYEPGFRTTKQSKAMIIELAATILKDQQIVLRSREAIGQWKIFQNEDGKLGAPSGKKDDCVIADALAVFGQFHPGAAPYHRPTNDEGRIAEEDLDDLFTMVSSIWKKNMEGSRQRWSEKNLEEEERINARIQKRLERSERQDPARWKKQSSPFS